MCIICHIVQLTRGRQGGGEKERNMRVMKLDRKDVLAKCIGQAGKG